MENVAELMFEKGTSFYKVGRIAIKWFLTIGVGLVALIMLFAGEYRVAYLALNGYYAFVTFLMVLGYIGTLVGLIGVPLYFLGLHFMGLGQIAKNTDNFNSDKTVCEELPEL